LAAVDVGGRQRRFIIIRRRRLARSLAFPCSQKLQVSTTIVTTKYFYPKGIRRKQRHF
jgi:hypothetical protein